MTAIAMNMLCPKMLTKMSASRMAGIDALMSTMRCTMWSTHPPYHPDTNPSVVPTVAEMNSAVSETKSAMREP